MKVEKNRKAATVWRDESSSIGGKGGGKAKWMDLGLMLKGRISKDFLCPNNMTAFSSPFCCFVSVVLFSFSHFI